MKLSQQQNTAAAMDQWITGIPGRIPGVVIFVENPDHTDYAKSLADEDSCVVVLNGDSDDTSIVTVSGSFDAAGKELRVNGTLSLQIADYIAIRFVNLVGTTVVRINTQADWHAFFDGADEACRSGRFVEQLTDANAVLAERGLLCGARQNNLMLARLHIAWDGSILSGPYGAKIGTVGDAPADLRVRAITLRPESAVAAVDYPSDLQDSLASRPWIPRYLAALGAWKFIPRTERFTTRLVGFGASLYGADPTEGFPSASAPFILKRGTEHTLLDTTTGRLSKIDPDAATIIEGLSNVKHVWAAAVKIAPGLGVPTPRAEESARAVLKRFDQLGIEILGAESTS